jgi:hypothetical protein
MTAGGVTETVSIVDQGAGLPWSAPGVISSALIIDAASDAAGDLTLALSMGSEVAVFLGNITKQHLERDDAGFRDRLRLWHGVRIRHNRAPAFS